ncbi:MAG: VCBS domain-containing protein, partial [Rhodoferax sp.]|nr:VCBS domain-containing protein [Rhodoferax sp.]
GVASGITYTTAYTEGGAAVKIVTADATITDQDSHLKQVVVNISNVQNAGSETLTIPGGNGANWNGITGLTVSGSGTSTITLTGDLPPNDYQLALRSISYANSSDAPGTTQRDITVVVTDINNHVGDTGHSYINLTAVNDAPVLANGTPTLTAVAEDVTDVANAGDTVASLINDGRITDPDLSSNVPEAIAVSAVVNTNGTWQYKLASGVWTAFDFTANTGKALLLDSADSIRFMPNADWNGSVANGVTFYAWDKTSSAVAGDYLTINGNTGTTQVLSTATGTFDITVTPVNDAPLLSGSGSDMASITEDATSDAGQAVSAFLATVNDIDSTPQGIAVYGTTVTGPTTGGKWQCKVDAGAWTDFGTVTEGAALLLKSTDLVRFVPDTKNGQTASFDYYAWDQYNGTAGSTASVATRGTTTAFSTTSDSVSITVTDLNDAPVLDLDTSVGGTAYSTNFLVRSGVGVAVANTSGISISDVDVTAANVHESIASATVAITAGAVDNTFGTTYETLTSGRGASVTSSLGGTITISGSGTTTITISGAGTPTEYQNIIKAITYENTNPNAYTGARTVTVTLTDSALTGGSAGTATATTTITNLWAPVVDTNGVATTLVTINGVSQEIGAGVKYVTSYTQGGSAVKVATADATITDEDSFLKSVVISIRDASGALVANADEKLTITLGNTANWNGLGLTVAGDGTDTITLSGNLPPSIYQLALRSISYANTASAPGEVTRTIHVVGTDIDNHVGYTGHTDINVIPVNSPPTLAAMAITGSVAEDVLASTTTDANLTGTLVGSDIETVAGDLVYGVSDGSAGSGADAGKVIATGTYGSLKVTTSGGAFEYVKNAAAIEALADGITGQDVFTLIVADGTGVGSLTNTSPPTNGPARTYTVVVTGDNDAPVATGTYTHTVTDSAALDTFTDLTGTLAATDVDTADTLTWSGSATGSYGALTVNANGTYSYVVNA